MTTEDAQQTKELLASILPSLRSHIWGSNAAYLLIFGALFYLQRQVDVANLRADMAILRVDLADVKKQVVQSQTVNVERPLTSEEERAIWIGKRADEIRRAKANHEPDK